MDASILLILYIILRIFFIKLEELDLRIVRLARNMALKESVEDGKHAGKKRKYRIKEQYDF